jgi:hypothetical protein
VKEYSREFQDRLAKEIEVAPKDAVFPEVLIDFWALRKQLSMCRSP